MRTQTIPYDIRNMSSEDLEKVVANSDLYLDGYSRDCQRELDSRLNEYEYEAIIAEWTIKNQNTLYDYFT
jgi:hypothetical protein